MTRHVLPMPSAVVRGLVETRGPARRYLEVDPIVRGMLRVQSSSARTTTEMNGSAPEHGAIRSGGLDPELPVG